MHKQKTRTICGHTRRSTYIMKTIMNGTPILARIQQLMGCFADKLHIPNLCRKCALAQLHDNWSCEDFAAHINQLDNELASAGRQERLFFCHTSFLDLLYLAAPSIEVGKLAADAPNFCELFNWDLCRCSWISASDCHISAIDAVTVDGAKAALSQLRERVATNLQPRAVLKKHSNIVVRGHISRTF